MDKKFKYKTLELVAGFASGLNEFQVRVANELQKMYDDGWEPVSFCPTRSGAFVTIRKLIQ